MGGSRSSHWLVILGSALYGTVTVGGQYFFDKGLSLYEIALFPMLLTALMLLPLAWAYWPRRSRESSLSFFLLYGLIGALAELAQFGGIVFGVPVAIVALLLHVQPIWTMLFSRIFLREQMTKIKLIAATTTIAGAAMLAQSKSRGTLEAWGIISALLGGVLISLWIILGKKSGTDQQHFVLTAAGWSGLSSLWLVVLWPAFFKLTNNDQLSSISFKNFANFWPELMLFALLAGVLPSLCIFKGISGVPASSAGIILLIEPISAAVLAALLYGQHIDAPIVLGGLLILSANALIVFKR